MAQANFSMDTAHVKAFWLTESPELAIIFEAIEQKEEWVVDVRYQDIAQRLVAFGERLKNQPDPSVLMDADRNDLLVFLVFITTSKVFRFIDYLNSFNHLGDLIIERVLNGAIIDNTISDAELIPVLTHRLQSALKASFCRQIINREIVDQFISAVREYRRYQEGEK